MLIRLKINKARKGLLQDGKPWAHCFGYDVDAESVCRPEEIGVDVMKCRCTPQVVDIIYQSGAKLPAVFECEFQLLNKGDGKEVSIYGARLAAPVPPAAVHAGK